MAKARGVKGDGTKRVRTRAKNVPSAKLRQLVDEATFRLFMENGYENTTMRQISDETGFGAGSLYNTFTGKEDILNDIIMSTYDDLILTVRKYLAEGKVDRLVAISFPMCVDVYAASVNPRYAELLHVAHTNWDIFNRLVDKTVEWELPFLQAMIPDITREEMTRNLQVCAAVMGRYIAEYHAEGPKDSYEGIAMCMRVFCELFKIDLGDSAPNIINGVIELFNREIKAGMFMLSPPDKR